MTFDSRHCWIFDMDGTITCSVHDFAYIRNKLGLAPGAEILESITKMRAVDRQKALRVVAQWEKELVQHATVQPGVVQLLTHLKERGDRLGVLTRNLRSLALETLEAVDVAGFFDPADVLGRDSAEPKPSPEGIQILLEHWKARPEEAVMVGDYLFDIQAGRAAGTATVFLNPGQSTQGTELADLVITTMEQLVTVVSA